ncbi:hypothetical protein EJB05_36093, partial [Eragrostis curvula]
MSDRGTVRAFDFTMSRAAAHQETNQSSPSAFGHPLMKLAAAHTSGNKKHRCPRGKDRHLCCANLFIPHELQVMAFGGSLTMNI